MKKTSGFLKKNLKEIMHHFFAKFDYISIANPPHRQSEKACMCFKKGRASAEYSQLYGIYKD